MMQNTSSSQQRLTDTHGSDLPSKKDSTRLNTDLPTSQFNSPPSHKPQFTDSQTLNLANGQNMSHSHFDYDGPRKSDPGPNEVGIIVYGYLPSLTLPVVAIVMFGFTLLAQVLYAVKKGRMYRTFHILMAIGSVSPPSYFLSYLSFTCPPSTSTRIIIPDVPSSILNGDQERTRADISVDRDRRLCHPSLLPLSPIQPRSIYSLLLDDRDGPCHLYRRRRFHTQHACRGIRAGDAGDFAITS